MVAFRIVWTHLMWLKLIAFHLEVVIDIVACSAAQLSLKTSLLYIFFVMLLQGLPFLFRFT
jgi:hypothetical protein